MINSLQKLPITAHTLDNGLRVVFCPRKHIPEVSIQLWYATGSRHERSGQRGMAHFLEHMLFKGTKNYSESDIDTLTHRLSGQTNAFTSHDYTGYLFDLPTPYWDTACAVLADCMINASLHESAMRCEVKAVVQELKMYRDDYTMTLIERMISLFFQGHPYHYPIIGYKRDLLTMTQGGLREFYQARYKPSQATLVVVGNLALPEVIKQAEMHFGALTQEMVQTMPVEISVQDTLWQDIVLYRDVEQPILLFGWRVPGVKAKLDGYLDASTWLIGAGRGSYLYRRLVDELALAQDVSCFVYDLFDYSVLCIQVVLLDLKSKERVTQEIVGMCTYFAEHKPDERAVTRAVKKTLSDLLQVFESNQQLAYLLGKYTTALQDPDFLKLYRLGDGADFKVWFRDFMQEYMRPFVGIRGAVQPFETPDDLRLWQQVQENEEREDEGIFEHIKNYKDAPEINSDRFSDTNTAKTLITLRPIAPIEIPEYSLTELAHGVSLIEVDCQDYEKTDLLIDFKAKHFYDPPAKPGIMTLLFDLLQEGAGERSGSEFGYTLESYGMSMSTFPGLISARCLRGDEGILFGLVGDSIKRPALTQESFQQVKERIRVDIRDYWDNPDSYINQLLKEALYKNHPYAFPLEGTQESLNLISHDDIIQAYTSYIVPAGTTIVVVGNGTRSTTQPALQELLSGWQGVLPSSIVYPVLSPIVAHSMVKKARRDQAVIMMGGLSVRRQDADYDALLLFDQVFTGGVLNSMSSRLFSIRQETGLFYTIGGSLVAACDEQPGMWYIKTIVSPDNVDYTKRLLIEQIDHAVDTLVASELHDACNAVVHTLAKQFATPAALGSTLLFMHKFGFSREYLSQRIDRLRSLSVLDVQQAVTKHVSSERMVTIIITR